MLQREVSATRLCGSRVAASGMRASSQPASDSTCFDVKEVPVVADDLRRAFIVEHGAQRFERRYLLLRDMVSSFIA